MEVLLLIQPVVLAQQVKDTLEAILLERVGIMVLVAAAVPVVLAAPVGQLEEPEGLEQMRIPLGRQQHLPVLVDIMLAEAVVLL